MQHRRRCLTFTPLLLSAAVHLAHADEVQLAPIDVSAVDSAQQQARDKSATVGPMGERRLQDTPYSVSVVPRELTEDQQLKSFKDMIRYLPSVQADGARPQTRGFQGSVVQNSRLDGLNVVSTTDYPAEQLGGVEVLSGLSGSLYGPANPAGTFNLLSKRPTDFTRNRVTVGLGTGMSWLKAVDLSGPFDPEGKIKYRLNLVDEQGHSYAPGSTLRRQLVSLATDFQLSDDSIIETNLSHYNYLDKGFPGKFATSGNGVTLPHALDATRSNLGQNYAGDNNTTDTASVHFKHNLDDNWKLDIGALRQIADRESTAVTNTFTDNAGRYASTVSSATASRFTINSYLANLNGTVYTGAIQHQLTFGLSGFDWDNYNPVAGATQKLGTASLGDPANFAEPDYPDFTDRYHSANASQRSLIVADTLTFNPQWSLMLSGSQNRLTTDNYTTTGGHFANQATGISSAESLMYKPIDDLTLYVTYADSLQQGDSIPAGSLNAGQILSPYRSRMVEVGGKWVVDGVNLSLAAFQMKRPFAYAQNNVYAVAGQQRNRGLEFMADGSLTRNLRVFGGITWLDPKLLDTATPSTDDTRIVGLARTTASLLTTYQIEQVPGLAVNLNARYMSARPIDDSNDHWVSSYETFDLGASYSTRVLKRDTVYRLEMTNVGNSHYWTNIVPGGLNGYTGAGQTSASLGAPRMLQASVQVDL
ncbi:TonB-dependent receptor [Pseudomonas sp. MWU16-30317]|uniref:TonB-dependent receptor n=1 Tax=Pseudomonas sp. MWU16-30317 TaxID=2878095 RepID=UPI001CFA8FD7|nr:TonB-dependent receptor [Pseudomonas sp. MWU16-30317]